MRSMFKSSLLALLILPFLFSGCGYKTTTVQKRDTGYLLFTKSSDKQYTVIVNNLKPFILGACENPEQCQDVKHNQYEVDSGNILLKVLDENQQLIIKKEIYLGSSNSVEVPLP